ncbi:MAG: hypothetical protein HQK49_15765 [Oligoflexia bacterium]|nr:hypothetical protein [Oligoflexia bacterium]
MKKITHSLTIIIYICFITSLITLVCLSNSYGMDEKTEKNTDNDVDTIYYEKLKHITGLKDLDLCSELYSSSLLGNEEVYNFAMMIAGQSFIQGGANVVTSGLAFDQEAQIQGMINQMSATPSAVVSTPGSIAQDALASECQLNPKLPQCQGNGLYKNNSLAGFTGDGSIDIGGASGGTYIGSGGSGIDGNSNDKSALAGGGSADSSQIGTVGGSSVGPYGSVTGGDFESQVGAAKVKGGGSGTTGSGGGGSAPGGSASGGGGGDGGGGANANKGGSGNSIASGVGYKPGGVGFGANSGGGSGKKNSDNGSDNPFDKYFGKKDGSSNDDKTLNFRDLASEGKIGDKTTSIFKRIQDRYQSVYSQKRLMQYDTVDKK